MGDPWGIGPEVVVKALADSALAGRARFVVFGQDEPLAAAARSLGVAPFWKTTQAGGRASGPGVFLVERTDVLPSAPGPRGPTAAGGAASFGFVEDAIAAVLGRSPGVPRLDAIVTAPISKHAWSLAGHAEYPGHTELLAERFGNPPTRMMFVSPRLKTILATTHIGLAEVSAALTVETVETTIALGKQACRRLGVERPRIAVCGVNPHASEGGLFGDEEKRVIAPAIARARNKGIDASGPWPGDTIFNAAVKGKYDLVVAMYHDQGLIPVKLLAFDQAVNVSVGLPVVRTSPDHGTAYDIAGKGIADPGSMRAAIELALKLVAGVS